MQYPGVTDIYDPAKTGSSNLNTIHYWNSTTEWKKLLFLKKKKTKKFHKILINIKSIYYYHFIILFLGLVGVIKLNTFFLLFVFYFYKNFYD